MPNSGSHDKFRIANFSSIIVNIVKMLGSLCLLAILPFYCKICMRNQLIVKIFKSMLAKSRFRPRGVNYIIKIFYDLGLTQPGASSTVFRTSPKTQQARGRCPLMSALAALLKFITLILLLSFQGDECVYHFSQTPPLSIVMIRAFLH